MSATTRMAAANRRGIISMASAMAIFIVSDAIVKVVGETMPVAQLMFLRGLMAGVLVFAAARVQGVAGQIGRIAQGRVVLRAICDACASVLYIGSLVHLPLGNATAINLATPLFITLFAVFMLREQVSLARWIAVLLGFAGVLLIIQPRADGFNAYALMCLAGTLCHAARDLLTRRIGRGTPSILITLSTAIVVTLLSGALSVVQGWLPFGPREFGLLALAAALQSAAYVLIINSMREGEMSLIAPFRYTGLLFALVLGYLVWGDIPNLLAWSGIALMVGAGLYMLHAERPRNLHDDS